MNEYLISYKSDDLLFEHTFFCSNDDLKVIYERCINFVKKHTLHYNPLNFYCNKSSINRYQLKINEEYSSMSVVLYNNELICLKRSDDKLVLPKGHIEKGEDIITAAIRECYEEAGITINKDNFIATLGKYDYSFNGAVFKHLTNEQFNDFFGCDIVHKTVYVNLFKIKEKQIGKITESYLFKDVFYLDLDYFIRHNDDDNLNHLLKRAKSL